LIFIDLSIMHSFIYLGFIPVFDHMLCSTAPQLLSSLRPFGPMLLDEVEKGPILLSSPLRLSDAIIEVVLPALSALFGSLEELPVGAEVEVLGYFVPLALLVRSWLIKQYL
jgi:hypothetical protein